MKRELIGIQSLIALSVFVVANAVAQVPSPPPFIPPSGAVPTGSSLPTGPNPSINPSSNQFVLPPASGVPNQPSFDSTAPPPNPTFNPNFNPPSVPSSGNPPPSRTMIQPPPPLPREEKFVPSEVVPVAPAAVRNNEVKAVLRTSMGDITLKLNRLKTPNTVAHFIALARGEKDFVDVTTSKRTRRPFYNQLIFHRVVRGYVIQTGCPFGNGRGGPGDIASIRDEINPPMKFDRPGLVAMAPMRNPTNTDTVKDALGSQFFITLRPMPEWDDKYTIFGEVEDGMDVVQKINGVKVGPTERPIKRVFLNAVDIFESNPDQGGALAPSAVVQPPLPSEAQAPQPDQPERQ